MKNFLMGLVALALIVTPSCVLVADGGCDKSDCETPCTAEQKAECETKGDCDKSACGEKKMAQCCADAKALGKDCEACAK